MLLCVSLLAACGGGGGGSNAFVPGGGAKGALGSAAMTIFVPNGATVSSAIAKRANALPSTTQSVEIFVASGTSTPLNPPVAPVTFNVSATAAGCSSVAGGVSCTETVTVPFGSLLFVVVAYSGANATGAAIAEGMSSATIGSSGNSVNITMNSAGIYAGVPLSGGIGYVTIDHAANTFSVTTPNNSHVTNGTVAALPNGDLKLVVTSSSDPTSTIGEIIYAREVQGSVVLFASTGGTTVIPTGGVTSGGDMGAGVGLQSCPTTASTSTVSAADVGGPAWNTTPTTSPVYTSGTGSFTVSGGTATVNFNGYEYSAGGTQGAAQSGSQQCSGGVFSATNQGTVAISPDGVIVVGNGSGNVMPTDVNEGSYGFEENITPGSINVAAVAAGTYDGFVGGFSTVNGSVTEAEQPYQLQPLSSNSMQACPYSNFEGNTVNTASCTTLSFGAQTQQPGVVLATAAPPNQPVAQGAVVVGQTSNGKYAIFGNIGGTTIEFLQH